MTDIGSGVWGGVSSIGVGYHRIRTDEECCNCGATPAGDETDLEWRALGVVEHYVDASHDAPFYLCPECDTVLKSVPTEPCKSVDWFRKRMIQNLRIVFDVHDPEGTKERRKAHGK